MKLRNFLFLLFWLSFETNLAQSLPDALQYFPWKKTVLSNEASFKTFGDLNLGSAFLMRYKNDTVALTARDFTGTIYTRGEMLLAKDFNQELKSWKLYVSDRPSQFVMVDSLLLKDRIEKKRSVVIISRPVWVMAISHVKGDFHPLEPDIRKIPNRDTLYLVGFDNDHNLKIIQGIVETSLNDKWAFPLIRLKTEIYLQYAGFVGGPIVDQNGKVVGVINRAYALRKNRKGQIINNDKKVDGSYLEYFVNGTSIRDVLGKDYSPY